MGTISKIILFPKEYFPSDSFALITLWKTTMMFSWFWRSIEGHKWVIPEWPCWMAKNACSSSFVVYRTCREIWWSSFFCYEVPFPVWSYLWIFSLGFSFLDFFDFSPLFLMEDTSNNNNNNQISGNYFFMSTMRSFLSLGDTES